MKLLMYGVNRDTVSSDDIHKYSLTRASRREHLHDIHAFDGVSEVVLLVTENRNEYYLYVDEKDFKHGDLLRYLSQYTDKMLEEVILETYSKFNEDVVRHLLNLSSNVETAEQHSYEPVDIIDQALMDAVEEKTAGPVLQMLFKNAVDFSLDLCEKESIRPLLQGNVPRAVRSIRSMLEPSGDHHYCVIGNEDLTNQIIKHFSGSDFGSLTVLYRNEHTERSVEELKRWLAITNQQNRIKLIHLVDSSQFLYRLAKADALLIGTCENHNCISEELLQDMFEMRPTAKNQLIFDFSTAQDETVFSRYASLTYKHIEDEAKKQYDTETMESAQTAFEELISVATGQYMNRYNEIQECQQFPALKKLQPIKEMASAEK
ncbi:hypothetical protein IRB23SM22_22550 [Alkalibacterium sp. s-m-22]